MMAHKHAGQACLCHHTIVSATQDPATKQSTRRQDDSLQNVAEQVSLMTETSDCNLSKVDQ